ncbi:hypothetical protein [Fredinandcohnia quinoae]|uniref:Uncharacterized protein n=1 Tax=Fredinandcohnia quinoae TaxID=2918902 RepID=A0AAW5E2X5_9BACI|nr:hypothetical protein [Fredinandcohnia sp. SECRCQ15]MCH1623935.1 hypothetical protein [Fredinandcohnia sp. SECRCQ15]
MKQVINVLKRKDGEKRLAVIRLEVDYELATLYDAIIENDETKKTECIQKLEKLRQEMVLLEA